MSERSDRSMSHPLCSVMRMPVEPITVDELRRDVSAVLDPYHISLDEFLAADLDDIHEPELRDLWLMTRNALVHASS
jgi:hypothetical protein